MFSHECNYEMGQAKVFLCYSIRHKYNKPGPAQVGAHIEGSKIAKGLQYVKVLVSWGPFYEKKFLEKKSHNAEKTEREDPSGVFNIHFVAKQQTN